MKQRRTKALQLAIQEFLENALGSITWYCETAPATPETPYGIWRMASDRPEIFVSGGGRYDHVDLYISNWHTEYDTCVDHRDEIEQAIDRDSIPVAGEGVVMAVYVNGRSVELDEAYRTDGEEVWQATLSVELKYWWESE